VKCVLLFATMMSAIISMAAETRFAVPSDPDAQYYVLDRGGSGTERTIVTKRVGPSGTSYSKRLYNCTSRAVKYLGGGDTLERMLSSSANAGMTPIVAGSVADYVGRIACA
jgi:hypothetical protein